MEYQFFDEVFLRTPFFSYARYDLQRLPEVLGLQVFRNALRLASPVLYAELEKKAFSFDGLSEREQRSLAKYYNRMCFRPTPFGGFAAFTLLSWSASGNTRLVSEADCRLHLLPDNTARSLIAGERLIANPSLYRFGSTWRYFRSRQDAKGLYQFSIDALDAVRLNNELLARCRHGQDREALVHWLAETSHCDLAAAGEYISFLVEDEVLLAADRGSPLSGEQARSVPALAPLPAGIYYAGMERPVFSGGPGTSVREALAGLLEKLKVLTQPAEMPGLQQFIRDFRQRFDQQKVPLLLALDPDAGIPFASTRLVGAAAPLPAARELPQAVTAGTQLDWTALRQLLFSLWKGGTRREYDPIVLDARQLSKLPPPAGLLPNTVAVMFRQTTFGLQLEHVAGVSGTQLLGRFSVFSEAARDCCRKLGALEEDANPGVLFADIGQLSHAHYDNVNRRRPCYSFEIPVNVYSNLPVENQLRPEDLLLSVRDGELLLESRRLGKRIIPRLTSAYNYQHTQLAVFQLLCELQYQGVAAGWTPDLEWLFPGLSFYPRLVIDGVILSPAKWHFTALVWQTLTPENFEIFRVTNGLPQLVAFGTGDQQLIFELVVPEELCLLLEISREMPFVRLEEYLPSQRTVKSGNKPLAAEFVAFYGHRALIYPPLPAGSNRPAGLRRTYQPGSDWLYLKLYCTPAMADRLLLEVILPVLRRLAPRIRGWFFVRYADPDYHLRLRFQLTAEDNGVLLAALQTQLKGRKLTGVVRGFQAETYVRELERYGSRWIPQVEKIFEAGSNLVLQRLSQRRHAELLAEAVDLGLAMIACFFSQLEEQLNFTGKMSASFQKEFKTDKVSRRTLDAAYRQFKNRSSGNPRINCRQLLRLLTELAASMSITGLSAREVMLADLIHMQLNRLFPQDQRQQELSVYYFLEKQLTGRLAQKKKSTNAG